jgi:hypothetical protein
MNQQKKLPAETRLNKVKSEFEIWRTTRKNRKPIPAELWKLAVELYPVFTISKISTTLALSYTDLKKRVQLKPEIFSVRQNEKPPTFIELDFPPPSPSIAECVVEMEDSSGAKMKMCFRGRTDFDLLELGKSFWRRQP